MLATQCFDEVHSKGGKVCLMRERGRGEERSAHDGEDGGEERSAREGRGGWGGEVMRGRTCMVMGQTPQFTDSILVLTGEGDHICAS